MQLFEERNEGGEPSIPRQGRTVPAVERGLAYASFPGHVANRVPSLERTSQGPSTLGVHFRGRPPLFVLGLVCGPSLSLAGRTPEKYLNTRAYSETCMMDALGVLSVLEG